MRRAAAGAMGSGAGGEGREARAALVAGREVARVMAATGAAAREVVKVAARVARVVGRAAATAAGRAVAREGCTEVAQGVGAEQETDGVVAEVTKGNQASYHGITWSSHVVSRDIGRWLCLITSVFRSFVG